MNKKILITGLSVIVLGSAHAAFWVYQSGKIKSSIEQMAGQISKEIGKKNTEFFFTSSKISGYPFNFTVDINQPKFISTGNGEKLELSSGEEHLIVTTNLVGSNYKIKLPSKVDVKYTVDEKEKNYKLEFANSSPEMEFKFSGNVLFSKDVADIIPYLSENLKSLRYTDQGYALSSAEDETKIASSDSDSIEITKSKGKSNSISTSYNIKLKNVDNAALYEEDDKTKDTITMAGLWPISANLDISSIDVRDDSGKSSSVDFLVRDADITAASFGFGVKGNVKANGEDIFPFGDLSIKVRDYKNMVDYFSGMVSNAFAQSKIPLFHIKSEKSIDFKKVLYEVASEKSNEDKDILLTLTREKGKSLFIGQKGLMEVIDLLKASASASPEAPKDASAPQPKLMDAAPAAGLLKVK